jgi:hypothetical protein
MYSQFNVLILGKLPVEWEKGGGNELKGAKSTYSRPRSGCSEARASKNGMQNCDLQQKTPISTDSSESSVVNTQMGFVAHRTSMSLSHILTSCSLTKASE